MWLLENFSFWSEQPQPAGVPVNPEYNFSSSMGALRTSERTNTTTPSITSEQIGKNLTALYSVSESAPSNDSRESHLSNSTAYGKWGVSSKILVSQKNSLDSANPKQCTIDNPNGLESVLNFTSYGRGLNMSQRPSGVSEHLNSVSENVGNSGRRNLRSSINARQTEKHIQNAGAEAAAEMSLDEDVAKFVIGGLMHLVDQNFVRSEVDKAKKMVPNFDALDPEVKRQFLLTIQIRIHLRYLLRYHAEKLLAKLQEYDAQNGTSYYAKFAPKILRLKALWAQLRNIKKMEELDQKYGLDVEGTLGNMWFTADENGDVFQKREKDFLWEVRRDDVYGDHMQVTFRVEGMNYGIKTNAQIVAQNQGTEAKKNFIREKLGLIAESLGQVDNAMQGDMLETERGPLTALKRQLDNEKARYEAMLADVGQEDASRDLAESDKKQKLGGSEENAKKTLSFMKNIYLGALGDQSLIDSFIRMTNEKNEQGIKIDLADGLEQKEKQLLLDTYKKILIERGSGLTIDGKKITGEQIAQIVDTFGANVFKENPDPMPVESSIAGFNVNKAFFERLLARQEGDGIPKPIDYRTLEGSFAQMNQKREEENIIAKFEVEYP